MVSGRFLFVTWIRGGNTAPTYPLVRCLVARGHTVTVLGQAPQGEGARCWICAAALPWLNTWQVPGGGDGPVGVAVIWPRAAGEAVLEHIERHATAVVAVDCMLSSSLGAAERSAIPSAAVVHFLYQQFVGGGSMGRMWSSMLPMINKTGTHLGLPPTECSTGLLDPMKVVLVACPQEFEIPMPVLPTNVRYVGAVLETLRC